MAVSTERRYTPHLHYLLCFFEDELTLRCDLPTTTFRERKFLLCQCQLNHLPRLLRRHPNQLDVSSDKPFYLSTSKVITAHDCYTCRLFNNRIAISQCLLLCLFVHLIHILLEMIEDIQCWATTISTSLSNHRIPCRLNYTNSIRRRRKC